MGCIWWLECCRPVDRTAGSDYGLSSHRKKPPQPGVESMDPTSSWYTALSMQLLAGWCTALSLALLAAELLLHSHTLTGRGISSCSCVTCSVCRVPTRDAQRPDSHLPATQTTRIHFLNQRMFHKMPGGFRMSHILGSFGGLRLLWCRSNQPNTFPWE